MRQDLIKSVNKPVRLKLAYPTTPSRVYAPNIAVSGNASMHTKPGVCKLDPNISSDLAIDFESELYARIIGQPQAVDTLVRAYKTFLIGMNPPNRPIAVLLFAGPTGVGKTQSTRAMASALYGDSHAYTKIDCGEFQSNHEIAKILSSPPGYLGHRETPALLTQAALDKFQTTKSPLNILLFDEIEKASDALWQLLLGVFDTGRLTLGTNQITDFSKTIIVMTTNLGAREMERIAKGQHIGFQQPETSSATAAVDTKIRGTFTPEFMNRIDSVVIFDKLERESLRKIFKLEMNALQERIVSSAAKCPIFVLRYTDAAESLLIDAGTDPRYGARELKRTIEKRVVTPLSNLLLSRQVHPSSTVTIDVDNDEIVFLEQTA